VIELQAHHGTRFSHGRRARAAASPSPFPQLQGGEQGAGNRDALGCIAVDGAGMRIGSQFGSHATRTASPSRTTRHRRVDRCGHRRRRRQLRQHDVTVLVACGVDGVGQGDDQPLGRQMSMAKESGAAPKAGGRGINNGPAVGARSCQHTHCGFPAHRLRPVGLSNVRGRPGNRARGGTGVGFSAATIRPPSARSHYPGDRFARSWRQIRINLETFS
jgi:hypothetical protein